jgi:hypothetical protein
MTDRSGRELHVGRAPVTVEELLALARGERAAVLWSDPAYRTRLDAAATVDRHRRMFGMATTGFGSACASAPASIGPILQNLIRSSAGTGAFCERQAARSPLHPLRVGHRCARPCSSGCGSCAFSRLKEVCRRERDLRPLLCRSARRAAR